MNLTPFNIKADTRDSIFLAAMVIQDTTNEFVTFLQTQQKLPRFVHHGAHSSCAVLAHAAEAT
jgi:hypothetical protein